MEVYKNDAATQEQVDAVYAELLKWYNDGGDYTEGGKTYKKLTESGNFRLSCFDRWINTDECVIFTPGAGLEQSVSTLTRSAAVLLRKNEKGTYVVEKVINGGAVGSDAYAREQFGFTVVPEGCLVIGASGKCDVPVRAAAEVGRILVPHGFDIESKTIGIGAYFTLEAPKPDGMIGDVDCDGKVEATDYMLLKRAILGTYKIGEEGYASADIDRDGKVEATDYMLLKRAILGTYKIADPNA